MCIDVLSYKEEDITDLEKLQNWRGGENPEDQPGYLIDGAAIPYDGKPTGVPKQYPVSKNAPEEEIQTIDLSGGGDDEEEEYFGKPARKPPKTAAKPKTKPTQVNDPCANLGGKKGWVAQDNAFGSQDYAAARAASLRAKGVVAQSTARSCFEGGGSGYIVWLGVVHSTEEAAKNAASNLEDTLLQMGLRKGKLLVRKI
jgi:cell division protein FtsN